MAITPLPPNPQRTDTPATFIAKADAHVAALTLWTDEANALQVDVNAKQVTVSAAAVSATASQAAALVSQNAASASAASALAAPGTNATSTTSLTVASGSISITIQTGKSFVVGAWINITRTSDVTKAMLGQITSYNSGTGALVTSVAAANVLGIGSGPYTDWTISQSSAPGNVITAIDLTTLGASVKPVLLCDFANSRLFDSRWAGTPPPASSYYNSSGILKYSSAGKVEFDHEPLTGVCRGLGIWEARTNALTYSEQLDNGVNGTPLNLTLTANTTVAPDGATTGDQLLETVTNGLHGQDLAPVAFTSGSAYTFSAFVKPINSRNIALVFPATTFTARTGAFDLTAGTVITSDAGVTAVIEQLRNGWWRCSISAACAVTSGGARPTYFGYNGGISYAGDITKGFSVWGVQVETGAFASPYIPTVASAVARAAWYPEMLLSAFDYNSVETTVLSSFESKATLAANFPRIWAISDGTDSNCVQVLRNSTTNSLYAEVKSGGVSYFDSNNGVTGFTGNRTTVAVSYKSNSAQFSKDGVTNSADATITMPVGVTRLTLGNDPTHAATTYMNGWISNISIFTKQLTTVEMTAITTQ